MKNIFIAIIFALIACVSARQATPYREDNKYKAYKEFKGDTSKYLTYNFIDGKSKYIGKPLNKLLNDLEFNIKSYTPFSLARDIAHTNGISVNFYDFDTHLERADMHEYSLNFTFDQLIPMDSIDLLNKEKNQVWGNLQKNFFEKQIINDIHMVIQPDPRLKRK